MPHRKPQACWDSGCPLAPTGQGFARGEGPKPCALAFFGEALGKDEAKESRPFVGGAGRVLALILKESGLRRNEVYIDNVLRCRPPGNKFPTGKEGAKAIQCCRQYDSWEDVKPKVIVTLGAHAMHLLTGKKGMDKWRAAVLRWE